MNELDAYLIIINKQNEIIEEKEKIIKNYEQIINKINKETNVHETIMKKIIDLYKEVEK